jgi:hypothetical protein
MFEVPLIGVLEATWSDWVGFVECETALAFSLQAAHPEDCAAHRTVGQDVPQGAVQRLGGTAIQGP